jgi:hypothetical protein
LGAAISTGFPLGIALAGGMPVACLLTTTRAAAFQSAAAYYLAALWPMIPAVVRYQWGTIVPWVLWVITALLLAIPWTIAWTANRDQFVWRVPLALAASVVPPLGIIGLASPLTAAGYIFPGTGWAGLLLILFLPGILLSVPVLTFRARWVALAFVTGFCIGVDLDAHIVGRTQPRPPVGWVAVNTHFGDLSAPFQDFRAAQFIQVTALESPTRVLIFPEAVVPTWSAATEAFWKESLDRCRTRRQILVFGAGLPSKTESDNRARLADLGHYEFEAAIDVLKTESSVRDPRYTRAVEPTPSPTDNALLVMGAESATYYQRVPVPVGMWRPFDRRSVPVRLISPGVVMIDSQRAAVLICYEQMLTFPILTSMLQRPTVLVGVSNTYWLDGTPVPRYQAAAVRAWAKLFRIPFVLAVNS